MIWEMYTCVSPSLALMYLKERKKERKIYALLTFVILPPQGWGAGRRFYEASIGLALRQQPDARRLIRCRGGGGPTCAGRDCLGKGVQPVHGRDPKPHADEVQRDGGVGVPPPPQYIIAAHHTCAARALACLLTMGSTCGGPCTYVNKCGYSCSVAPPCWCGMGLPADI